MKLDEERIKRDGIAARLAWRTFDKILQIYMDEGRIARVVIE